MAELRLVAAGSVAEDAAALVLAALSADAGFPRVAAVLADALVAVPVAVPAAAPVEGSGIAVDVDVAAAAVVVVPVAAAVVVAVPVAAAVATGWSAWGHLVDDLD